MMESILFSPLLSLSEVAQKDTILMLAMKKMRRKSTTKITNRAVALHRCLLPLLSSPRGRETKMVILQMTLLRTWGRRSTKLLWEMYMDASRKEVKRVGFLPEFFPPFQSLCSVWKKTNRWLVFLFEKEEETFGMEGNWSL